MARIDQEKIHAIQTDAYHDYLRSRANGTSQDTPRKEMHVPREGDFTWVGGERVGSYVHGSRGWTMGRVLLRTTLRSCT